MLFINNVKCMNFVHFGTSYDQGPIPLNIFCFLLFHYML